jgi:hypothetical protein
VNDHFGHAGEVTPLAPWLGGFVKPNNLAGLGHGRKGELRYPGGHVIGRPPSTCKCR